MRGIQCCITSSLLLFLLQTTTLAQTPVYKSKAGSFYIQNLGAGAGGLFVEFNPPFAACANTARLHMHAQLSTTNLIF